MQTVNILVALLVIMQNWKQPHCPLIDKWINKWYRLMEYYSVIKNKLHRWASKTFTNVLEKTKLQRQRSHQQLQEPRLRGWDELQETTGELSGMKDVLYFDCGSGSWLHAPIKFIKLYN